MRQAPINIQLNSLDKLIKQIIETHQNNIANFPRILAMAVFSLLQMAYLVNSVMGRNSVISTVFNLLTVAAILFAVVFYYYVRIDTKSPAFNMALLTQDINGNSQSAETYQQIFQAMLENEQDVSKNIMNIQKQLIPKLHMGNMVLSSANFGVPGFIGAAAFSAVYHKLDLPAPRPQ